jgi:hypothetical protein
MRFRALEKSDLWLCGILGLSITLNLAYITWGLPGLWHPDELVTFMMSQAATNSFVPPWYIAPLHFHSILLLVFVPFLSAKVLINLFSGKSLLSDIDPGFWSLAPE